MKTFTALLCTALLAQTAIAADGDLVERRSEYGDQDLWVFSSAWQPELCANQTTNGCKNPSEFMKTHLTIGALVPTYFNGRQQDPLCRYTYGTFLPENIKKAGRADLIQYWPVTTAADLSNSWTGKYKSDQPDTPEYDWTCSGLEQVDYLKASVQAAKKVGTPAVIANHIGGSVPTDALRGDRSHAILKCSSDGKSLSHYVTCWAKDKTTYYPTKQIACPHAIKKQEDTCSSPVITIRAFQ